MTSNGLLYYTVYFSNENAKLTVYASFPGTEPRNSLKQLSEETNTASVEMPDLDMEFLERAKSSR